LRRPRRPRLPGALLEQVPRHEAGRSAAGADAGRARARLQAGGRASHHPAERLAGRVQQVPARLPAGRQRSHRGTHRQDVRPV
nr:hypothetical protein [Tanacetum cinerariifolium]